MKLEIAAGENPQKMGEGWIRHDKRSLPNIDVVCDWRRLQWFLPQFKFGDITEIYCRHFIEHLSVEDGHKFVKMCYDLLVSGGDLEIVCPDMRWLCRKYLSNGYVDPSEFVCWMFGGGDDEEWSYHKSGYDAHLLCRLMKVAGFTITWVEHGDFYLRIKGRKGPDGIVRLRRTSE